VITECFEQGNILLHSIGSSILDCSLCIAWWHARHSGYFWNYLCWL